MDLQNFENVQAIEWSPSQTCFHIHSVGELLEHNQRTFIRGNPGDYIPIGFFESKEALDAFMVGAREHRRKLLGGNGLD